jgi:hypothetical protein
MRRLSGGGAAGVGRWLRAALAVAALGPGVALAEPYLAIQQGYQCIMCHVNPTGGGARNAFGDLFAENVMAMTTLPAGVPAWTGQVVPDFVRIGGDLRTEWSRTTMPQAPIQQQVGLEQVRLYADVSVIPNELGVYVDQLIAPGAAQTMEAYVRYGNTSDWYLKAGHFYLPFGWRLQDQTAFVREATGINMNSPDDGVELGFQRPNWSGQLDVTKGAANAGSPSGYMVTGNLVRVQTLWRFGASAALTHALSGDRQTYGVYAGLRTGPIAWLGEADLVRQSDTVTGTVSSVPLLGEIDWALYRGNNLKLTYEFYDPDWSVHNNQQTRWSALYELTPIPFLQVRAGFRRYQGIPQSAVQNETLSFLEVHGFF